MSDKKVALIVGAGDAIGSAIAKEFAEKGFTVPVGEWIAKESVRIGPLVAAQAGVAERCHPAAVTALFASTGKRERFAAWTLLFFALWHQRHIVGDTTEGDVFAVLG